jgi:hypothetical protein
MVAKAWCIQFCSLDACAYERSRRVAAAHGMALQRFTVGRWCGFTPAFLKFRIPVAIAS